MRAQVMQHDSSCSTCSAGTYLLYIATEAQGAEGVAAATDAVRRAVRLLVLDNAVPLFWSGIYVQVCVDRAPPPARWCCCDGRGC